MPEQPALQGGDLRGRWQALLDSTRINGSWTSSVPRDQQATLRKVLEETRRLTLVVSK